jgi:hypothetical protein
MDTSQTPFQAIADQLVEQVITLADMAEMKIDVFYCLQELPGPAPCEELAYLFSSGDCEVFLATDSRGRMWLCDDTGRVAREITTTSDITAVTSEMMDALDCPILGREYVHTH